LPPERHLQLVPSPRPEPTWRDREWWDWGGVVGFLLIVVGPNVTFATYGILALLR
jgi:hypothetical protein